MDKSSVYKLIRMICYSLGFPLILCLVLISAGVYFGEPVYEKTVYFSIVAVLVMWLVVEGVRLILKVSVKNNRSLQTIILAFVALIVIAIPLVLVDYLYINPTYAAVKEEYDAKTVTYYDNSGNSVTVKLSDEVEIATITQLKGYYNYVTDRSRKDKSMSIQLIEKTNKFCIDYNINKWLSFYDYSFGSDSRYDGFGTVYGVQTTLTQAIEQMEGYITAYNNAVEAAGGDVSAVNAKIVANFELAVNGGKYLSPQFDETANINNNGWSIYELYALDFELSYQTTFFPYFAAKQYLLIGIGLELLSIVLVAYMSDKIAKGKTKKKANKAEGDAPADLNGQNADAALSVSVNE